MATLTLVADPATSAAALFDRDERPREGHAVDARRDGFKSLDDLRQELFALVARLEPWEQRRALLDLRCAVSRSTEMSLDAQAHGLDLELRWALSLPQPNRVYAAALVAARLHLGHDITIAQGAAVDALWGEQADGAVLVKGDAAPPPDHSRPRLRLAATGTRRKVSRRRPTLRAVARRLGGLS